MHMLCTCIILCLFPSAIQLACVNSPVCKVENTIRKLLFCRNLSYSPKLTSLWKHQFLCIIFHRNQLNLMELVHAMHSNGPLPQIGAQLDPHQWTLQKLNLKNYHLHNGKLLFRKSANRFWLKKIKHFLHRLERDLAETQIRMMSKLYRSYLQKNFKAQSETAQKLIEDVI